MVRLLAGMMLVALAGCASELRYVAPPGTPASTLEADLSACRDEARIVRDRDERDRVVGYCMSDRGYAVDKSGGG